MIFVYILIFILVIFGLFLKAVEVFGINPAHEKTKQQLKDLKEELAATKANEEYAQRITPMRGVIASQGNTGEREYNYAISLGQTAYERKHGKKFNL